MFITPLLHVDDGGGEWESVVCLERVKLPNNLTPNMRHDVIHTPEVN